MTAPEAAGPLSFVQEEILERMTAYLDCAKRYDMVDAMVLNPPLSPQRLERAVATTVARHPILRTTLGHHAGATVQRVAPIAQVHTPIHVADRALSPAGFLTGLRDARLDAAAVLGGAPLFRLCLAPADGGGQLLGVLIHHLLTDSAGYRVLWRDLSAALLGTPLPPAPFDYIAHARQERAAFADVAEPALTALRAFADLPVEQPKQFGTGPTRQMTTECDAAARAGLATAARRHRMPPFLVALAATAQTWGQLMGRGGVPLSTDFENREAPGRREHVAPFVNSRLCVLENPSRPLDELLPDLRAQWLDAEAFRAVHTYPLRAHLGWPEPLSVQRDADDAATLPDVPGVHASPLTISGEDRYWRDALFNWRLHPGRAVVELTTRTDRVPTDVAAEAGPRIAAALAALV